MCFELADDEVVKQLRLSVVVVDRRKLLLDAILSVVSSLQCGHAYYSVKELDYALTFELSFHYYTPES